MKKLILIFFIFMNCQGNNQMNLTELTIAQWQQDLDYLTDKIDKKFAGFSPELKTRFNEEAAKIKVLIPTLSVTQRIMELARLMAILNDGHTEISVSGAETNFHRLPLLLYYFGSDLRIVGTTPSHKNLLGNKVTKIENRSVTDIFEKLNPYMNGDNDIEYITSAPTLMMMPEVLKVIGVVQNFSKVSITITNDQGIETRAELVPLTRNEYDKTEFARVYTNAPLYLENLERGYWFKYLPESKVMYVNITTLVNQKGSTAIKKVMKEMLKQFDQKQAEILIVDFRLCRGGNYNNILPLVAEVKKRTPLNKKGNLFVVNGRLTFSAASVATIYFKDETQAIVVGEVSRAKPNWADNVESYSLPNSKLKFDCLEKIKIHSKALGDSKIIPVDIEIPRSFELYKAGRDEVTEYILSLKK